MITLKIEDLKHKNIDMKGKQEFVFQNKLFKRKTTVSKIYQEEIIQIAEQHRVDELEIILLEHNRYFSIWLESKSLKDSKENLNNFVNQKLGELGL